MSSACCSPLLSSWCDHKKPAILQYQTNEAYVRDKNCFHHSILFRNLSFIFGTPKFEFPWFRIQLCIIPPPHRLKSLILCFATFFLVKLLSNFLLSLERGKKSQENKTYASLKMPQDSFELCNLQLRDLWVKDVSDFIVTLINPLQILFRCQFKPLKRSEHVVCIMPSTFLQNKANQHVSWTGTSSAAKITEKTNKTRTRFSEPKSTEKGLRLRHGIIDCLF